MFGIGTIKSINAYRSSRKHEQLARATNAAGTKRTLTAVDRELISGRKTGRTSK